MLCVFCFTIRIASNELIEAQKNYNMKLATLMGRWALWALIDSSEQFYHVLNFRWVKIPSKHV